MKIYSPINMRAPDRAKVNANNRAAIMQDVSIKSIDQDSSIQVLASQAINNDMHRLKAAPLHLVRDNRYFDSVLSEEANGFIFLNKIDSTSLYGFRHIIYQGDQEFGCQNSFEGIFTLEQLEAMYAAVKQKQ